MRAKGQMAMETWLRSDEILGYIINSYAGVEPVSAELAKMRRVFLWEEEHEVKMGNTEAFTLHLGRRFERQVRPGDASLLHKLLRDLGDAIAPHSKHSPPRPDSPKKGLFRQPDPEEWIIRQKMN